MLHLTRVIDSDTQFGYDNDCNFEGDYSNWWEFNRCVEIKSLRDLLEVQSYRLANLIIDDDV